VGVHQPGVRQLRPCPSWAHVQPTPIEPGLSQKRFNRVWHKGWLQIPDSIPSLEPRESARIELGSMTIASWDRAQQTIAYLALVLIMEVSMECFTEVFSI